MAARRREGSMPQERRTAQKEAVFSAVHALDHPSAAEVYEYLKGRGPAVSRGTVFRVLSSFSENGKLKKLHLLGDEAHYDFNTSPHAHAHCRVCGRVWDISAALSPALPEGFSPKESELEISGVCAACRKG